MKMRNIAALLFLTVSVAGIMDAAGKKRSKSTAPTSRPQPTCDKMVHGTKEESFVQRMSCARQAMAAGDYAQAYELMAPIFKHAKTSKSITARDSKDKLGAIVRSRLGDRAQNILNKYKVDDVYVAVALVDDVDPNSGKAKIDDKTRKRFALPEGLESEVRASMAGRMFQEEQQATEEMEDVGGFWEGIEGTRAPTPSAPVAPVRPSAPMEDLRWHGPAPETGEYTAPEMMAGPGSPEGIAEWQRIMAQEELMIFTLNALLIQVFEKLLEQNEFQLIQALTDAVKRADNQDIELLKNIIQKMQTGFGLNAAVAYLAEAKSSWLGRVSILVRPDWRAKDYVEQWVSTSPDSKLIAVLQGKDQLKSNTLQNAQNYLEGKVNVNFDDMFRRAEALRLARTAAGLLENKNLKEIKFVEDAYNNLVGSLNLDTSTKQMKQPMVRGDLNSISAQLGEIQGNLLVDAIPADKISAKDRATLKSTFSKAAKIGGVVAVTAIVALIATKTQIGQDAIAKAGQSITTLYSYLPSVPESVKAYVPSLGGIGAAVGSTFEKVKGAAQMIPGSGMLARATGAVVGGVQSLVAGAISTSLVGWLGSQVSSSFAANVAVGRGLQAMGQAAGAEALQQGLAAFGRPGSAVQEVRSGAQFQEPGEPYVESQEGFGGL